MEGTFFELPDGHVVCFNPTGRWHGWLFRRHADGSLVSVRKLSLASLPLSSVPQTPIKASPKSVEDFNSDRIARNCDNWNAGTCQVCGVQWQNCEVHWSFSCPQFVWHHEITDEKRRASNPVPQAPQACQKCGTPTEGEEALVDGQIWCHPCADDAPVSRPDNAKGG